MILAILAAGAFQTSFGPALPMGTSPDLYRAFNQVKQEMANGRFDSAKQKLQLLPASVVTYSWNDQKVPAAKRAELVEIRTQAFRSIANRVPGLSFKASPKPAISFTFEKSLAYDPTSGLPRGVALFFTESLGEPRLEAVIGLNRGNPLELTNNISLHNEVMFATASYLGLAPGAFLGTMMGRVDLQMQYHSNVDISESATIVAVREAVNSLRQAVDKKQRLSPGNPKASFSPAIVERGPIIQGVPLEFSVQVSNLGNAPLSFRVIPDCGCVNATGPAVAAPGSSVVVKIRVDTTEILGELNKHLILFSNDSEVPVQKFPIHVRTTPRYRFLSQEPNVLIVGDTGLDTELFLVSPKEKPLDIKSIEIVGNSGTATFEPWEGELPDPELNELKKLRSGYRLKIHLDEPGVSGRSAAVVQIKTGDAIYPLVRHTLFAQKGIAALPASVFFGDLGRSERQAAIILTRPNKPFKILRIESDSSFVDGRATTTKDDWEYRLSFTYNGKAPIGDFRAMITVFTDDVKQSKIRIPVMGLVK